MMEVLRRMQVTGRGSYIVSLPKKWVQQLKLDKGEYIVIRSGPDKSLTLVPRRVMVAADKGRRDVEIIISPKEEPNSIVRKIVSLYLIGFNVIVLRASYGRFSSEQTDIIRELIRKKLVGAEIVTESYEKIILQVLLSYSEFSVDNAIRRMAMIALSMFQDSVSSFRERGSSLAEDVIGMDDEVDRFSFYVIRQLKMAVQNQSLLRELGLKSPRDCLGFRLITKSVERVADHAVNIAENAVHLRQEIKPSVYEDVNRVGRFVASLFKDSIEALFGGDYDGAEQVLKQARRLDGMEAKATSILFRSRTNAEDLSRIRLIIESVKRVGEYSADISEIVLNLTVLESLKKNEKIDIRRSPP